jgi:hypothetical protein
MNNSIRKIYGSYEIPDEIYKLYELEVELNDIDLSLDIIGFQPCLHDYSYSITPPDLIPFANTGGDGIHFGFLTDFGKVPTLTEAPIICVSPTNDPPIRYMAHNINEFLNLVSSVPHAEMLEGFWSNPNEVHIQAEIVEFTKDTPSDWKEKRRMVSERLINKYLTQQVNIGHYLQKGQKERSNSISISTLDGLGIMGSEGINSTYKKYQFDFNKLLDNNELKRINNHLKESSRIEKLAFIRDAIYSFMFSPDSEDNLFYLIIELMQSMNLHDEVQRLHLRK